MAAVEDEETQRKGIVGILYNICEKLRYYNACTLLRTAKLRNALPARYVAMHYFHNDPSFMEYVNFELCHLDANTRARTRIHHGESFVFGRLLRNVWLTFSRATSISTSTHSPPSILRNRPEASLMLATITSARIVFSHFSQIS